MKSTATMTHLSNKIMAGIFCLTLLGTGSTAFASERGANMGKTKIEPTPASAAKEANVKDTAHREVKRRSKGLDQQAIAANDQMHQAILLLKKKDTKGAFKALEKADGELSVIMARDPHLKLAAIGVRANVIDLTSAPKAIHRAERAAEKDLDHGRIQAARDTLSPLTSEMHIDTDYLPLEIYPDAIKRASREIQESKLRKAESTLADAMSSIVTITDVIPLPPVKAEGDVLQAERLQKEGVEKNKDKILSLLANANRNLASAEALGYGKFQDIRNEIDSIQSKIKGGSAKPDIFQRAKDMLDKFIHGVESKA